MLKKKKKKKDAHRSHRKNTFMTVKRILSKSDNPVSIT